MLGEAVFRVPGSSLARHRTINTQESAS
jgi:hypothetical protein